MLIRFSLFLLWLLHFLPLPLLRALGAAFGLVLYALGRERRRVARVNLRLCFPELNNCQRRRLARRHFIAFGQSFLDRALLWWSSPERLKRLVTVRGLEHLPADDTPVILLTPHFVGLDAAWTRLTLERPMLSVYGNQKNPVFDAALYAGRTRFNSPLLISRLDGLRKAVKAMAGGRPFYYLPDMDFGPRDALFVPFFGVAAATIPGVPRLAKLAGAQVLPCIVRMTPAGYEVTVEPAWADYPSADVAADTHRMNAYIEARVRQMPEQYFWLHKRFKTRPSGEAKFY